MLKKKTRSLLKKNKNLKGLLPFSQTLCKYQVGQMVCIRPTNENIWNAPNRNFCGKIGQIKEVFRRAYLILIGNKKIYTSSSHLKKLDQSVHVKKS